MKSYYTCLKDGRRLLIAAQSKRAAYEATGIVPNMWAIWSDGEGIAKPYLQVETRPYSNEFEPAPNETTHQ